MDANVRQTWLICRSAGRVMIEQGRGGKVVLVSSVRGRFATPAGTSAYGTSKAATDMLTRSLAVEWGKYRINVNAIAPGYFTTDLTAPLHQNDPVRETIRLRIPAGHWGDADDLKGVAVLLASPAGRYLHGATIVVDGGWLAR